MITALANHVWQSTVFAAAAFLLTLALRRNHARVRHAVWLAASVKFLVPFSLLVSAGSMVEWHRAAAIARPELPAVVEQVSQPFLFAETPGRHRAPAPHWPAALWMAGSAAILAHWWTRWLRARVVLRAARPVRAEGGILVVSSKAGMEPGVFGIFRPVLVLPEGIAERLPPDQLRAIIAHELCHVKHRDNLAAAIHMVVESVFWFHPLVWWIGTQLVDERERACDEEVLRLGSEPEVYAESILNACKYYLESPLACVSGVTGADLKRRIEDIMRNRTAIRLDFPRKVMLTVAGAIAVAPPFAIGLLHAQQPRQAFEAAAIKPMPPYTGGPLRVSMGVEKGRINYNNVTLRAVVQKAYGVPGYLISGPSWITQDRYSINAKASGPASESQMMPMLQTLLEDRFKLMFHREPREMAVYALVIGKNGPKLRESKGEGDTEIGDAEGDGKVSARRASMKQLAGLLTRQLDRPVVDMTGLTGSYDFILEAADARGGPDATGPSIFTAIQEQLGLKLEGRRAPVDTFVIDRAERVPTEN